MVTNEVVILCFLGFIAVSLTHTMFTKREMMLGFPSAMFWALTGGQGFIISTVVWDIYHFIGISCALGMTIFSVIAMYGLREKHDTIAEQSIEKGDGEYVDEEDENVTPRQKRVQERAKIRRERLS